MRKTILLLISVLMAVSCGYGSRDVKIGLLTSETGKYSPLLNSGVKGVILGVEEINSLGVLRLKLDIRDDESRAQMTKINAQQLIGKKPAAVLCNITSSSYAAVEDLFNSSGMLAISATASSTQFSGKDDYLIRTTVGVRPYVKITGRRMMENGLRNIAVIFDKGNISYSRSLIDSLEDVFAGDGYEYELLSYSYDSMQNPDFANLSAEVAGGNPEALLIIASPLDTALIAQYITLLIKGLPLFTSSWGVSAELIQHGGGSVEGMYLASIDKKYLDSPEYASFRDKFNSRFGEDPSYQSVLNYDTVHFLARAIDHSSRVTPDEIRKSFIEIGTFEGLQGTYIIDEYGDCSIDVAEYTIKNGRIIPLD